MPHADVYIVVACLLGLLMTWGVGANDLANVMSTSMGSRAITVRQALIIAVIFEFAGAFLGGSNVTETMRSGIINTDMLPGQTDILIYGMLSVLTASMLWMNLASYFGMPVSITNAIVGAIVGFAIVVLGADSVKWQHVSYIAICWLLAPIFAAALAYGLFISIQRNILSKPTPILYAKKYLPLYLLLVGIVLANITIMKGLVHFGFILGHTEKFLLYLITSLVVVMIGDISMRSLTQKPITHKLQAQFIYIEKMFAILMAFTACIMVFAHGSNDVAIAVGPLTIIISLVQDSGSFLQQSYPAWITLLGVVGVILGMFMYGRKVIETVGSGITALTPTRAFSATLAAATAVVICTSLGIPVSATQTLVGAVLGVGLAGGINALNLNVIQKIFASWIITIPAATLLTIIIYYILRALLIGIH